jgi:protease-4
MFEEIKRTREEFKKPVIAYCQAVAASGAYYAAVGADKIFTTPGCMIGSIGALMEFVNMEKLYDWAKIHRYAITTGKYKDAGADYKSLAPDERELFQGLLDDVLRQFKEAVADGRKMKMEVLNQYADGRVFTGAQAVKLGFADEIGTWDDARRALGQMTGLGDDPKVFKARKSRGWRDFLEDGANSESRLKNIAEQVLQMNLAGQPLFLLPGAVRF